MIAAAAVLLLLLGVAHFFWTLRRGIYRRIPYELFALVGGAALLGVFAALEHPATVTVGLFGVELVALALLTWYMGIGARFPRGEVAVKVGDRFPQFRLPDSEGGEFDSSSLAGRSTALYLFYRGDW
jgi:hypothetical protein